MLNLALNKGLGVAGSSNVFLRAIRGWTDGLNCDEGRGAELSPDVNFAVALPPNADPTLGFVVVLGTPTVTGGQLVLANGDIASCTSTTLGEFVNGNEFEIIVDVAAIGSGGLDISLGGESLPMIMNTGITNLRVTLSSATPNNDIGVSAFGGGTSGTLNSLTVKRVIAGAYAVNFNTSVTYSSQAGVNLIKNIGLANEQTLPATTSTISSAKTIIYDVPAWTVPVRRGDTVTLDIGVGSNYENVNKTEESEQLNDSMTGADGAAVNGRTPDTVGANTWVGGGVFQTNGLGQIKYNFTANSRIINYDVGGLNKKSTVVFRYIAGALTTHVAGFILRGSSASDNVTALVLSSSEIRITERVAGVDNSLTVNVPIGQDARASYLTYEVIDDGTNLSIECIETGAIATILATDTVIAADNQTGLFYRNVSAANEILVDSFEASTIGFEQIQAQQLTLVNCLDGTLATVDTTSPLSANLLSMQYFDSATVGNNDIYRDLSVNNIRALPVTQLQDFVGVQSGDTLSHQGYTTDGTSHYAIDTGILYKYPDDSTWTTAPVFSDRNTTPFASLEVGSSHIGDSQYFEGQLICPITNNTATAPFLAQIAFYDVTAGLPYQHHVLIPDDGTGAEYSASGISVDSAKREVLIMAYYEAFDRLMVYDIDVLKATPAGTIAPLKRVIILNVDSFNTQGFYYKNDTNEIWTSLNLGDIHVYNDEGIFLRSYFAHSSEFTPTGGNQGLDFSTSELRLCKSNASTQGIIYYFDLTAIPVKTPTFDGTGERLELYHALRLIFDANANVQLADTGTMVARISLRSVSTSVFVDERISSGLWQMRSQDGSFPKKLSAYVNSPTPVIDGAAQDTWIDVAFTWDRKADTDAEWTVVLDGVQSAPAVGTWVTVPEYIGLGCINRFRGSSADATLADNDMEYFIVYSTVKTLTEINAIHADPKGILK